MAKKLLSLICTISLVLTLGACSSSVGESSNAETTSQTSADTDIEETTSQTMSSSQESTDTTATDTGTGVLVVVFSVTGHTKDIAAKIAAIEGADIYEIVPAVPYTDNDINYGDDSSRTSIEQNDPTIRPEIGSEKIDISKYSKIYVGYPIWWGQEPRIMDTFVETYDFGNATVIPFCTSGSSGIGNSGTNLAANAGSGNWLEGKRFASGTSEDEVKAWIEGMNI